MGQKTDGKTNDFSQLCKQFHSVYQGSHSRRRTGRILYKTMWTRGCLNDTLVRYLQEKDFPYLRTMNGDIWFLDDTDTWTTAEYDVQGSTLTAYEMKLWDDNAVQ